MARLTTQPTATPVFRGLTRPVSLMGLPMTYVVVLLLGSVGGFIATLSIVYLIVSIVAGYAGLRALAAWDARLLDVTFTVIRTTPPTPDTIQGRGVQYGA